MIALALTLVVAGTLYQLLRLPLSGPLEHRRSG